MKRTVAPRAHLEYAEVFVLVVMKTTCHRIPQTCFERISRSTPLDPGSVLREGLASSSYLSGPRAPSLNPLLFTDSHGLIEQLTGPTPLLRCSTFRSSEGLPLQLCLPVPA